MRYLICGIAAVAAGILAYACAPMFPKAVFTYARHPDFPRTRFLAGKLGVFQPGYARSYLVIAYRYLQGPPLSPVEQQQVQDYWKDRGTGVWDKTTTNWVSVWRKQREQVPGAARLSYAKAGDGQWGYNGAHNEFFLNCADDAYRTAAETLGRRIRTFGASNSAVRSWRDAQDAVFANCASPGAETPPAGANLPPVIAADREYQLAAADFYAGRFGEAETAFRRIAAGDSEWKLISRYLVVRTLAREAGDDRALLSHAEEEARKILAEPRLAGIHGMTRALLYRLLIRRADEGYMHELAADLTGGREARSMREELWDYTTVYDKLAGYDPFGDFVEKKPEIDPAPFRKDDLSDWIYTFQDTSGTSAAHALARYKQRKTIPWLIAALEHVDAANAGSRDLIAAAGQIAPSHPGFEIASFYRLRLMVDGGQKEQARAELDRILAGPMDGSARNLFRSLRMRTAPDLKDFLTFAARRPVLLTTDWNFGETPPRPDDDWTPNLVAKAVGQMMLDRDAIKILNEQVPLRSLRAAAINGPLPPFAARDFVLSAFTRALLLEDSDNGLPLAAKLRSIGADTENYLGPYISAKDPLDRRFEGVYYLLHHPEARPYLSSGMGRLGRPNRMDPYRDNWWCPIDIPIELDARTEWGQFGGPLQARAPADSPRWSSAMVSAEDRRIAAVESRKLAATLSAPDYLISETMRYAKAHPNDPRMPEAIHYALRTQRYGCVREQTAAAAEQAWRYLWRKYPKDPWTKKSNYSFEGENLPKVGRF